MHPAEAILDAAVAAIETEVGSAVPVYLHRAESVEEAEMPCVCVNFGEDSPGDAQGLEVLDSIQQILVTAKVVDDSESLVKQSLLDLRAKIHRGMAQVTGETWFVEYGGASAPNLTQSARMVGEITATWLAHYSTELDDPE